MKKYLLITVLLLCLLLSACGASAVVEAAQSAVQELAPVATEQVASGIVAVTPEPTAVPTPEPTEVPIAVAVTERETTNCSGEYTDSVGNTITYRYRLPQVLGESGYIGAVNVEIDGIYNSFIAPELESMAGGYSLVTTSVTWRAAQYNGILSLIIIVRNDWGCDSYYVYHFNTVDGKQATNADVFAALSITGEQFATAAGEAMSRYLNYDGITDPDEATIAAINDVRYKSLNEGNINDSLPVYVTAEGILCFVGRAYSLAGADYYDHLFVIIPEGGFSDEALCSLSLDYYESTCGYRPGLAAADSTDPEAIAIQLYDNFSDHNSTSAWYTLNRSGSGTGLNGNPIDITVQ